jgi:hypothetical protein
MSADSSSIAEPSTPMQTAPIASPSPHQKDDQANTVSKAAEATVGDPSSTRDRLQTWVKNVAQDSQTQVEEFLEQVDARQSGE